MHIDYFSINHILKKMLYSTINKNNTIFSQNMRKREKNITLL